MSEIAAPGPTSSVCPRCGAEFRCGIAAGDAGCWCANLPLLPLPAPATAAAPASGCFCPACLQAMQARLEAPR